MGKMRVQAIAVHTELIHDDRVWTHLTIFLALLRRRGGRVTFFVYPFRAVVAGETIRARRRVMYLARLGYEIGQHTHYYVGTLINKPHKVVDLSATNVEHCVRRDYEWLASICLPKGFVSGGWAVPESLYPTLSRLGFKYDCSARHSALRRQPETPRLWLDSPRLYKDENGQVLLLPTTHTLREISKPWSGRWARVSGAKVFRLVYFHDYDLVRPVAFLAAITLLFRPAIWESTAVLAEECRRSAHESI